MASDASFLRGYLPYLLRQADQTLSAPFYARLTSHGIARSDWRVLAVLVDLGELGVADLAAAALSPQPTVTHALRRLEDRGLIRRTTGAIDRRQRLVSLTPAGTRLARALAAEATELETDALAGAGDLSELVRQLGRLTTSVQTHLQRQITGEPASTRRGPR